MLCINMFTIFSGIIYGIIWVFEYGNISSHPILHSRKHINFIIVAYKLNKYVVSFIVVASFTAYI